MRIHKGLLMAVAVAVAAPGAALARDATAEDEARIQARVAELARPAPLEGQMGMGQEAAGPHVNVRALGGPVWHTGEARRVATTGGVYGVNAGLNFGPVIGAELGYQGQSYKTEATGGPRSNIQEHGGQALARVRAPLGNVEPYALGGLNVTRLNVKEDTAVAGMARDDTMFRLPLGAGVDYLIGSPEAGGVTLGVRGLYQLGLDKGAFPTTPRATSSSQLLGMASVGGAW